MPVARSAWCLALLLGAVACSPSPDAAANVTLKCVVTPEPPRVGPATLDVQLSEQGHPLEGATVRVRAKSDGGIELINPASAVENGQGRYRAQVEFLKTGKTMLEIGVDLADGRTFERTVDAREVVPR